MKAIQLAVVLVSIFTTFNCYGQDSVFTMQGKVEQHTGNIACLAVSQNGKYIASGSWDRSLIVYKADTPNQFSKIHTFTRHSAAVSCAYFSKDGKYLVTGGKDFSVNVLNTEKGFDNFMSFMDFKDAVTQVYIDPKSKFVYASSNDGTLRWYDITDAAANAKPRFIKTAGPIPCFLVAPGAKGFMLGTNTGLINVSDGRGTILKKLVGHTDAINALDATADGKWMASAGNDKKVIIWDLNTGAIKFTLQGHKWKVVSVNFSSDGKYLVSACTGGKILVWETETGKMVKGISIEEGDIRAAVLSADLKELYFAPKIESASKYGFYVYKTPLKKFVPAAKTPGKPGTGTNTGKPGVGTVPGKPGSSTTTPSKPGNTGSKPAGNTSKPK